MLYDLKGVVTFSCFFSTLFTYTAMVWCQYSYVDFNHGIIVYKKAQPKFYQTFYKIIKVRKMANIRNRYNQAPDPGYQWESENVTIRHYKREPRGQPFPSR